MSFVSVEFHEFLFPKAIVFNFLVMPSNKKLSYFYVEILALKIVLNLIYIDLV